MKRSLIALSAFLVAGTVQAQVPPTQPYAMSKLPESLSGKMLVTGYIDLTGGVAHVIQECRHVNTSVLYARRIERLGEPPVTYWKAGWTLDPEREGSCNWATVSGPERVR
jgi:hypothetical protein